MKTQVLTIKKDFNCAKRELFDAWSQVGLLSKWFFAAPEKYKDSRVNSNFTVNGEYSLTMYFENGTESSIWGHYQEIIRYSTIVMSWNSAIAKDSLVALNFIDLSPNRTRLLLKHTNFPDDESLNAHQNGWQACLLNLEKLFEQGE